MSRQLMKHACYIDGKWVTSQAQGAIDVTNPATGEVIGNVPNLGATETQAAIQAADKALADWAGRTASERAAILQRFYNLMLEERESLAAILTAEQGKPLKEARGEIVYAASFLEWFAEEAKRAYGEVIPAKQADKRIIVLKQPIGVVAAITPWNFPSAMITRKIGPALAAGCTVVLKPAEQTPFSALALAALAEEAGVPPGVFNVITGNAADIGGELTSSPVVRKISFTGSTEIGKLLMRQSADTIKKLSLELGGNAPFIVFDDADLDAAVEGAVISKYRNAGQTCVCANRFYVHEDVYDAFAAKLTKAVSTLKAGNGADQDTDLGPLIDQDAKAKVHSHLQDALSRGARVLCGGAPSDSEDPFFPATVLSDVPADALLAREETFGPIAGLIRFCEDDEVIAAANNSQSGLAAYFYSSDMSRIWKVAEGLEVGMVGINTGLISTEVAPFGGVKQSGLGREGSHHGLDDYMELKYLCMAV
ncbi:MAG: succinate-semialdehyde dehydrogenase (NADP(+)) [Hirschia sp.]|nr:succinate-semialdehyde dehydrogenase (NADP(+)) [Hirschia sp.]MBF19914.1 succinate-semialdehyde dehydrogenase (NADP(+)) [Hirschia sp.]